jgi:hypothetical protein
VTIAGVIAFGCEVWIAWILMDSRTRIRKLERRCERELHQHPGRGWPMPKPRRPDPALPDEWGSRPTDYPSEA